MEYFSLTLGDREHLELLVKGYLKIKFVIEKEHLKTFNGIYRIGKEVTFDYRGEPIRAIVTVIDVSEEDGDSSKVFLGFARQ